MICFMKSLTKFASTLLCGLLLLSLGGLSSASAYNLAQVTGIAVPKTDGGDKLVPQLEALAVGDSLAFPLTGAPISERVLVTKQSQEAFVFGWHPSAVREYGWVTTVSGSHATLEDVGELVNLNIEKFVRNVATAREVTILPLFARSGFSTEPTQDTKYLWVPTGYLVLVGRKH